MKKRKFKVWISPYKRTRDTAEIISSSFSLSLILNCKIEKKESIFLSEQQFGLFEGLPTSAISSLYPNEFNYFEKGSLFIFIFIIMNLLLLFIIIIIYYLFLLL